MDHDPNSMDHLRSLLRQDTLSGRALSAHVARVRMGLQDVAARPLTDSERAELQALSDLLTGLTLLVLEQRGQLEDVRNSLGAALDSVSEAVKTIRTLTERH